jgi:hypothetical protein
MALSHSFKVLFRHSFEQSLYLLFVLAIAFGLSFVENLFKVTHRPLFLIYGARYASTFALIIDLVAWALLVVIGLYRLFRRPWHDEEHNEEDEIPV